MSVPVTGPQWTAEQRLAIEARGRRTLVAASAGTGKTAVLSERVARAVVAGDLDVTELLVLTFTDAAAEEMRHRIAGRLRSAVHDRDDPRLRRQLLKLDTAAIGTLHAFCKRLVDRYFYDWGLDPGYRLLDEDDSRLLRLEVLREVVDQAWEDATLAARLPELLQGRSLRWRGDDFLAVILQVHSFLEGLADPDAWLQRVTQDPADDAALRHWGLHRLTTCRDRLRFAARLDRETLEGAYLLDPIQEQYLPLVEGLIDALRTCPVADWAEVLSGIDWPAAKRRPRRLTAEQARPVKTLLDSARRDLQGLRQWVTIAEEASLNQAALTQTRVLVDLVDRYRRAYQQAKLGRHCLDFSDLERYALDLLGRRADLAGRLAQSYRWVLVDEVQDINPVQQAILQRISLPDRVFFVGDVKQSIYGFRQSRPEIFLEELAAATPAETNAPGPLRIDLRENFRSRPELLRFVNVLCERLMTPSLAGLAYDRRAALVSGIDSWPTQVGTAVELVLLDEADPDVSTPNDEEDLPVPGAIDASLLTASQRQAAFIARRIGELVGDAAVPVFDRTTGQPRPARYGDIVILMRSLTGPVSAFVEVLRLAGIPVDTQSAAGYFAATEISDMLSLLKVLDNPRRDVELAAVLRSPLFGFTEDDLVAVRLAGDETLGQDHGFYDALSAAAQAGQPKALAAQDRLRRWRRLAQQRRLAQLIWTVYRQTDLLPLVSGLPNGDQRRANLLKLHDRAIAFEGHQPAGAARGLGRFVEFIEHLIEEGADWAPAPVGTPDQDAVRLMTVHHSKGLEFPIVFLAGLQRRFNRRDSQGACLLDESLGLGLEVIRDQRRLRPLRYELLRQQRRQRSLAEEMRILYVALTRARERLILCGSSPLDPCRRVVETAAAGPDGSVPDWMAAEAASLLDWILMGLAPRPELRPLFEPSATPVAADPLFQARRLDRAELNRLTQEILARRTQRHQPLRLPRAATRPPSAWALAVQRALDWHYPARPSTRTPAKQSVSERAHPDDEFAQLDLERARRARPRAVAREKPDGQTGGDPRRRGTAAHLLLETLPLHQPVDPALVQAHHHTLIQQGRLHPGDLTEADLASVVHFFNSPLGRLCRAPGRRILREWPFTLRVHEADTAADDFVVVQGIVDLVVLGEDEAHVVDFKTDRVEPSQLNERVDLYRGQIALYRRAVAAAYPHLSVRGHLYFLHGRHTVDL